MRRLAAVLLLALLPSLALAAEPAVVDPGRTMLAVEGRDRGAPRPIALTLACRARCRIGWR